MWEEIEIPWIDAESFLSLMKKFGSENILIKSGSRKQVKQGTIKLDLIRAVVCVKTEALERIRDEIEEYLKEPPK